MKTIFGKVVWLGRATVFLVGLSVILAAVFAIASMAFAANGKPLLLGRSNVATAITTLVKQRPGPALRLRVGGGPPMAVNSKARVANLNADKVDGKDADAFLGDTITVVGSSGPIAPNDFGTVIALCPPGHQATGGGPSLENVFTMVVTQSSPLINGNDAFSTPNGQNPAADGWVAHARNNGTTNQTMKVAVVCAAG
jgi:hypothetical protein